MTQQNRHQHIILPLMKPENGVMTIVPLHPSLKCTSLRIQHKRKNPSSST